MLHFVGGGALVRRILEEERRLELALPRSVRQRARLRCHAPARVQLEQLHGHGLQRSARALSLLCPALSTQFVQSRRRRIRSHVAGRAVALDLVDAVERDVQAITAFVLDHRRFYGALAHEDAFDPAVDPHTVLQVHDEVTRRQSRNAVERSSAGVAPAAPDPPLATEDLVVGEHAQTREALARRYHEPAVDHADGQRGIRGADPLVRQELVEPLRLAGVVAQDDRRHLTAHDVPQTPYVPVHRFGRKHGEADRRFRLRAGFIGDIRAQHQRAESRERRVRRGRVAEEIFAGGRIFTATARQVDVMLRLFPGARHLGLHVRVRRDHDERVGREQIRERAARRAFHFGSRAPVDGKDERKFRLTRGTLRPDVEVAHRRDLIAPELYSHRVRHPEPVDVDDAAAHAELCHVFHQPNALEAHRLEVLHEIGGASHLAYSQLEARGAHGIAESRQLLHCACSRGEDSYLSACHALQRLHSLAGDLDVRFDFAEALARRIQRDPLALAERGEVGEPTLGVGHRGRDYRNEASGAQLTGQCGSERRVR